MHSIQLFIHSFSPSWHSSQTHKQCHPTLNSEHNFVFANTNDIRNYWHVEGGSEMVVWLTMADWNILTDRPTQFRSPVFSVCKNVKTKTLRHNLNLPWPQNVTSPVISDPLCCFPRPPCLGPCLQTQSLLKQKAAFRGTERKQTAVTLQLYCPF